MGFGSLMGLLFLGDLLGVICLSGKDGRNSGVC